VAKIVELRKMSVVRRTKKTIDLNKENDLDFQPLCTPKSNTSPYLRGGQLIFPLGG